MRIIIMIKNIYIIYIIYVRVNPKWLNVDRYRDTAGYQGYGEIQAGYRWNTCGTSQKYTPGEGLGLTR